jgi:3'(2'), 5'-bisphosphate nucleotidase
MDKSLWGEIEKIAIEAGKKTLKYRSNDIVSRQKYDGSPVTDADFASNKHILTRLSKLCQIHILTEEAVTDIDLLNGYCFVVDPLDGTKSFISGRDDFCVNIGLLKDGEPFAGVIFAPLLEDLYSCFDGQAYLNSKPLQFKKRAAPYKGARSFSHPKDEELEFAKFNNVDSFLAQGAALKFASMICSRVDLYVRFAPCSEWDTAAGHALLKAYGGDIMDLKTKETLRYGKPSYLNGPFVAYIDGMSIKFPENLEKVLTKD